MPSMCSCTFMLRWSTAGRRTDEDVWLARKLRSKRSMLCPRWRGPTTHYQQRNSLNACRLIAAHLGYSFRRTSRVATAAAGRPLPWLMPGRRTFSTTARPSCNRRITCAIRRPRRFRSRSTKACACGMPSDPSITGRICSNNAGVALLRRREFRCPLRWKQILRSGASAPA